MKARYLGFTFVLAGFFLGVLLPLFAGLMATSFWFLGVGLFGAFAAFFLFIALLDTVEINVFEWILKSRGAGRHLDEGRSSVKTCLYSFVLAFAVGLSASLIFSPTAVVDFLGKVLDNPLL